MASHNLPTTRAISYHLPKRKWQFLPDGGSTAKELIYTIVFLALQSFIACLGLFTRTHWQHRPGSVRSKTISQVFLFNYPHLQTYFQVGAILTVGAVYHIGAILAISAIFHVGTILALGTTCHVRTLLAFVTVAAVAAEWTVDTVIAIGALELFVSIFQPINLGIPVGSMVLEWSI